MKEFPPFRLDTVNQCLWRRKESADDERILLKPKPFAILKYLVDHAGRLVTQEELIGAVWPDTFVQPEVLKRHIFEIRDVLGDDPKIPLFVETLPRRGYQFIAAVRNPASPEPAATDTRAQAKVVGRDRALGELQGYLQKVLGGQRRIVFVTGEPGIGKTTLVDEFQRQAATGAPLRVARGQCVEGYGGKEAYYPMLEALSILCRGPEGEFVVQILAAHAPTWLVQFPSLVKRQQREMLQREIMGATRQRMLREIGDALEVIALDNPLLLVLEDLHWADPSTVDLISAFARGRGLAKLLLIGTYRPVDVTLSEHPLKVVKQDLLVHKLCHELALEPLREMDIAGYLAGAAPDAEVPNGLAALLHRHSEGNPLFMVAALEHMSKRGLITLVNGSWQVTVPLQEIDLEVPENLRQMIEAQVERLSAEELRVLEVASLGTGSFSVAGSAPAADLAPDIFEETCEGLSRRYHIVRPAGSRQFPDGTVSPCYEFAHALYRESCYRRTAPGRAAKLHRRIGERLEALFATRLTEVAAELADHFEAGSDWPRAVKYLQLAADTTSRRFEQRQAADILEHARGLMRRLPDAQRAEHEITILDRLATICGASDFPRAIATCEDLISRAAHFGLIEVEVSAILKMAWLLLWINPERCLKSLERAVQLSAAYNDPLLRARTVVAWSLCSVYAGGWDAKHAEDCGEAIDVIRQRANRLVLGLNLIDYGTIQWLSSEYRAGYQNAAEGIAAIIQESGNDPHLKDAYLRQIIVPWNLLFLGELGQALLKIDEGAATMDRNGDYHLAQACRLYGGWVHYHALDFAGVLRICEPPLASLKNVEEYRMDAQFCATLIASAELSLGNWERARVILSTTQKDMERKSLATDWYFRMPLESALTELWLAKGDLAQARSQAEKLLKTTLATAEHTWQALAWEVSARIALAETDLNRAEECVVKGLSAMEGFEVPLAGWRVHATAAELYNRAGERALAAQHRGRSQETILQLAHSLCSVEPLRQTFLSAPLVRKVLGESQASTLSKEA